MKKLWIKLTMFLVAIVVVPMFIPGPDGKPIMNLDDWIPHDLISGVGNVLGDLSNAVSSGNLLPANSEGNQNKIYTWRDDYGGLHYSDTPVDGAVIAEIPEHNVTNSVKPRKSLTDPPQGSSQSGKSSFDNVNGLMGGDLSTAPEVLKQLPEMLKQARAVRQVDVD